MIDSSADAINQYLYYMFSVKSPSEGSPSHVKSVPAGPGAPPLPDRQQDGPPPPLSARPSGGPAWRRLWAAGAGELQDQQGLWSRT